MPIVTEYLEYYFHYRDGVSDGIMRNLAPSPDEGTAKEAILNGCSLTSDGIYFDGVDDFITILNEYGMYNIFTIELVITPIIKNTQPSLLAVSNNSIIGVKNTQSIGVGGSAGIEPVYDLVNNQQTMYTFVFQGKPTKNYTVYQKTKDSTTYNKVNIVNPSSNSLYSSITGNLIIGSLNNTPTGFFNGYLTSFKLYDSQLTEEEVVNNHKYFDKIGLTDEQPSQVYPYPTVISVSKPRISFQQGKNATAIKFKFDKDVTEWEVRVLGAGNGTGLLAESGGSATANEELTAVIDYTELSIEGQNKVNIYGKDSSGNWTPYES